MMINGIKVARINEINNKLVKINSLKKSLEIKLPTKILL